jgi:hypothetical protein
MSTEVVKASKSVKANTTTVGNHLDAVGRAREIYLAQIKRAEADYFERIERATEIFARGDGVAHEQPHVEAPAAEPAPPAS